jgi:hypothetical protein
VSSKHWEGKGFFSAVADPVLREAREAKEARDKRVSTASLSDSNKQFSIVIDRSSFGDQLPSFVDQMQDNVLNESYEPTEDALDESYEPTEDVLAESNEPTEEATDSILQLEEGQADSRSPERRRVTDASTSSPLIMPNVI